MKWWFVRRPKPPVAKWRKCPACNGTGRIDAQGALRLPTTENEPYIEVTALLAQGICLACRGRGGHETHTD